MTMEHQTIRMYRGTDTKIEVSMTTPEEIGDWSLTATFREYPTSPNELFAAKTVGNGIEITDVGQGGSTGAFTIQLDDVDTKDLAPGTYAWDAKRMDEGNEHVLAQGSLILLASTTR